MRFHLRLGNVSDVMFHINTCCGPLRSFSPMHVRSTFGWCEFQCDSFF